MRTKFFAVKTFAVAILLSFSNAGFAQKLEKAEIDGRLTSQQYDVLTDIAKCPKPSVQRIRKMSPDGKTVLKEQEKILPGAAYDCLLRKFNLAGNYVKYKKQKLQMIYNKLVEESGNTEVNYKKSKTLVDGHKRIQTYATRTNSDVTCQDEEWIQIAFDTDRMYARPITSKEMSKFIQRAYLSTVGAALCANNWPDYVFFTATVGDDVVYEGKFKAEYGYALNHRTINQNAIKEFGNTIADDLLKAAYASQ